MASSFISLVVRQSHDEIDGAPTGSPVKDSAIRHTSGPIRKTSISSTAGPVSSRTLNPPDAAQTGFSHRARSVGHRRRTAADARAGRRSAPSRRSRSTGPPSTRAPTGSWRTMAGSSAVARRRVQEPSEAEIHGRRIRPGGPGRSSRRAARADRRLRWSRIASPLSRATGIPSTHSDRRRHSREDIRCAASRRTAPPQIVGIAVELGRRGDLAQAAVGMTATRSDMVIASAWSCVT